METVLIIHGTGAGPSPDAKQSQWWQPGSSFCKSLDGLLAASGSRARCWSHLETGLPFNTGPPNRRRFVRQDPTTRRSGAEFHWSGNNSEVARRNAAVELRAYLRALEMEPRLDRYHLLAHSHGGNVVAHALDGLGFRAEKLGTITFLGTPFLHFRSPAER